MDYICYFFNWIWGLLNTNFALFIATLIVGYWQYRLQRNIFIINKRSDRLRELLERKQQIYDIFHTTHDKNKTHIELFDELNEMFDNHKRLLENEEYQEVLKDIKKEDEEINKSIKKITS